MNPDYLFFKGANFPFHFEPLLQNDNGTPGKRAYIIL